MAAEQPRPTKPGAKTGKPAAQTSGELAERPIEALLYQIHKSNLETQLTLEQGGARRNLFFSGGKLFFATSSVASEGFLTYLQEQTAITSTQFQEIKSRDPGDGTSLFASGAAPIPDLKKLARDFATQRCIACFQNTAGTFALQALPQNLQKLGIDGVDPRGLMLAGICGAYQMDHLARKFDKIQERVLVCTPEVIELINTLPFTPAEVEFIKGIDGKKTVTQLAMSAGGDLLGALRLVWALFSLRMIGMAPTAESRKEAAAIADAAKGKARPAPAAPLAPPPPKEVVLDPKQLRSEILERFKVFEKENYFQILGVDAKTPGGLVRKAFLSLAKRFHPDVLSSLGLIDITKQAGAIFAKMTIAHDTLTSAEQRKEYEASLAVDPNVISRMNDIIKAEMEFQKGEILLRNRSYAGALAQFELALKMNPDEAEHYVYTAWARFLNAKGDKSAAAKEAQKMIQKGLTMRANMDSAYLFLGRIAKACNNNQEAEKHFLKCVQLNPANDQAETELRLMDRRR